jgi:pimeloyl-ACP methyl ester carboxylesterase
MSLYRTQAGAQLIAQRYREFLSYWPQPNRQFHVPTRFGETFVVSCGTDEAPPVLLFHGAGSNSAMWIRDAAGWSARFKVYAIDIIGEPGFSAESRPPLNSDAYALWLDEVLAALHLDRLSIIGMSLGGWLALSYATRRPARVDRLALIVPAGIGRQRSSFLFKVLPLLLLGDWGRKRAMQMVIGAATETSSDGHAAYLEYMMMVQRHFRPRIERLPIFPDSALRQLTMPVLAILGAKDVILDSAETRSRLERCVPRAAIRYLPDLGHGVFGEREAILEFLTSPSLDNQIGARR